MLRTWSQASLRWSQSPESNICSQQWLWDQLSASRQVRSPRLCLRRSHRPAPAGWDASCALLLCWAPHEELLEESSTTAKSQRFGPFLACLGAGWEKDLKPLFSYNQIFVMKLHQNSWVIPDWFLVGLANDPSTYTAFAVTYFLATRVFLVKNKACRCNTLR